MYLDCFANAKCFLIFNLQSRILGGLNSEWDITHPFNFILLLVLLSIYSLNVINV